MVSYSYGVVEMGIGFHCLNIIFISLPDAALLATGQVYPVLGRDIADLS